MSVRFAAYDSFDAVFARKRWSYRAKVAFLRAHRGRATGLGAAVTVWMLIPGLNVIGQSAGAAGATAAYVELTGQVALSHTR